MPLRVSWRDVPADALDAIGLDESALAAEARTLVARVIGALGVDGQVDGGRG